MRIIVIIQARMGSTRLPGKVLMPLGESVVLDYVVQRSRKIRGVAEVVVATSTLEKDNPIADWCHDQAVSCFRGSEDDVLDRYYSCAKAYETDYVIRVTADCPFLDYDVGSDMVDTILESQKKFDLVRIEAGLPRGLPVELISYDSLKYIHKVGQEDRHREHVTYYAYEFSEEFSFKRVSLTEAKKKPDLRITLDTEDDYTLCQAIANYFPGNILIDSQAVIDYLVENPDIAQINAHIEQKPIK